MLSKSKIIISFFIIIITTGAFGFYLIEDSWSVFDSIYMTWTIITLSTVGFGDAQPLSLFGKIWAMIVIVFGVSGFAMVITQISSYFIKFEDYRIKKMIKKIKKLRNHYILCGFGRMGAVIAKDLNEKKIPFVIIENNERKVNTIKKLNYLYLYEDATFDKTLIDAGLMHSKGIAVTLNTDQDNLFVTMTVKTLNPDCYLLSRCSYEETGVKLKRAGANKVVNPYITGGHRMKELLISPYLEDAAFMNAEKPNIDFALEEIKIKDFPELNNKKINDTNIRKSFGLNIVGVIDKKGNKVINPNSDYILNKEDNIVLIGDTKNFEKFFNKI